MSFGSRSLPAMTGEERERVARCKTFGCIACRNDGQFTSEFGAEYHHLLVGGIRAGHRFGIALCTAHHRGGQCTGVSLAAGSKPFHARYGGDQALLDYQDRLIGWEPVKLPTRRLKARKPLTKIYRP